MEGHIQTNTTAPIDTVVAVVNAADRPHAKHSPSSWEKKLICPGWRGMSGGPAADRGSLGHKAVEENNPELCGEDAELRAAVIKILDFKKSFLKKFEGMVHANATTILKEQKLAVLDQFGYFDELWIRGDQAVLLDYKFAYNEYRADSGQFWGYCIGIWDKLPGIKQIRVVVLLPFRDEIDEEVFSRDEHYEKFVTLGTAIIRRAEANDPATYTEGAHCAYCKMAGTCTKLGNMALTVAHKTAPHRLALPETWDPALINDPDTMGKALALARLLGDAKTGWCKRVRDRALEMAVNEANTPTGYVLRQSSAPRRVTNVRAAYEAIKDKVDLDRFLDACGVDIGDLETIFAETADKGGKAKAKSELDVRLRDINAITQGEPVWKLVVEKQ